MAHHLEPDTLTNCCIKHSKTPYYWHKIGIKFFKKRTQLFYKGCDKAAGGWMGKQECRIDAQTQSLVDVLTKQYKVPQQEIDSGYRVIRQDENGTRFSIIEGKGDGCPSYQEALNKSFEISINETLLANANQSSLNHILAREHNIRMPWFIYKSDKDPSFASEKWEIVVKDLERIRKSVIKDKFAPDSPEFKREFGRRIFSELIPFHMLKDGEIDPMQVVFRLFSAYISAGFKTSFVAVPMDPFGKPIPTHVALSIGIGKNQSIIVDPAYETYDLKILRTLPLDFTQALSMNYTHRAINSKEPRPLFAMARRIDPDNRYAGIMDIFARSKVDDPLSIYRHIDWGRFKRSREEIKRVKASGQLHPIKK